MLWVIAAAIGRQTGEEYQRGVDKAKELEAAGQTGPSAELLAINRTRNGVVFHAAASPRRSSSSST